MYLMKVSVNSYGGNSKESVAAVTLEQWEGICEGIVDGAERTKAMAARLHEEAQQNQYFSFNAVVTVESAEKMSEAGLKFDVSRVRGLFSEANTGNPQEILAAAQVSKSQIHIHVPGGVALMEIDTVHWLEDACTNELQRYLDREWRIIAVCPANDSRRPTYILGRKGEE